MEEKEVEKNKKLISGHEEKVKEKEGLEHKKKVVFEGLRKGTDLCFYCLLSIQNILDLTALQ